MRNSVRLKLIPQLKIYNMNIKEVILQTILLLTEDNIYLEGKAAEIFSAVTLFSGEERVQLDIQKLSRLELPLQGHLLRLAIAKVKGNLFQLSFSHVQAILEKLPDTEKWELDLPDGICVMGERGKLTVSRGRPAVSEAKPFRYTLNVPAELPLPEIGLVMRSSFVAEAEINADQRLAFLDYNELGKEIIVRSREPGDRFSPLGIRGTKKLQDFFVDEKVPQAERERIPVVESGGRIVWVAGLRIDERAKVTSRTKKIVRLELR